MFKPLIKKVREESTNASILAENQSDAVNGHSTKEQQHDNPDPSSVYRHRRSHSNALSTATNQSRASSVSLEENKEEEEIVKTFSSLFSSYTDEPVTTRNYLRVFKSWITSKEEHLQERDEHIDQLTQQNNEVQNELSLLRNRITTIQTSRDKTPTNTAYLQKQLDRLRSDNENLKSTNKSLQSQLNDVQAERDDLLITSTDVSNIKLQEDLQRLKGDNQQQHSEIERLRELLIERDRIIEEQDRRLLIDHETQSTQTDEENSFVESLAEPDVDTISKLQAELDDKNRTIKILQQRYNDLRKTLQREFHASIPKDLNQLGSTKSATTNAHPQPSSPTTLPLIHYDAPVTSQSDVDAAKRASTARQNNAVRKNVTFTTNTAATAGPASAAILPHTSAEPSPTKNQKSTPRSSVDGQATLTATNFRYLKHVLLKFMTSTEDEAIHLIRAVSTLLNFSSDEERLLRETLDYKMSWFGKVARLKPVT